MSEILLFDTSEKTYSNNWIESLALPTGQYFSYKEEYSDSKNGYFVFSHLNLPPGHLVIVEPNELTFKYYNEVNYANKDFFKISINNNSSAATIIETNIIDLSTDPLFKQLFGDFLIDLYANNGFQECGKEQELKLTLESIPLIQGIIHNTVFKYYSELFMEKDLLLNSDENNFFLKRGFLSLKYFVRLWNLNLPSVTFVDEKTQKKNEDGSERIQNSITKKVKLSFHNWTNFMLSPRNEKYFSETNSWFESSLDSELIKAKKQLHFGLETTNVNNIDVEDTRRIARHFIKRYGIFEAISLSWQKKPGKKISGNLLTKISLVIILITVLCIVGNFLVHNFLPESRNIFHFVTPFVFIGNVAWVFVISFITNKAKIFPSILLPRMIIAIISGWLFFMTAEELLKIDYDLSCGIIFVIGFFTLVLLFVFVTSEIRHYGSSMKRSSIFGRASILILLSFTISYFIGFFVMSYVNKKFISIDNFLVSESTLAKDKIDTFEMMKKTDLILDNFNILFSDFTDKIKDPIYRNKTTQNGNVHRNSKITTIRNLEEKLIRFNLPLRNIVISDSTFQMYRDTIQKTLYKLKNDTRTKTWSQINQNFADLSISFNSYYQSKKEAMKQKMEEYKGGNINKEFIEMAENGVTINDQEIKTQKFNFIIDDITIMPNLIFLRSILAMFIGVFLQLIIQDKSITEPL